MDLRFWIRHRIQRMRSIYQRHGVVKVVTETLRFLTWKRILRIAPRKVLYTYLTVGRRLFPWRYTDGIAWP